jgi:hypothetical protein
MTRLPKHRIAFKTVRHFDLGETKHYYFGLTTKGSIIFFI